MIIIKIKNIYFIGFKNFIKDKLNIFSIVIMALTFALLILSFSFQKSLNNYWNESVKKLVDYRTYLVAYSNKYSKEEAIEKLKNYDHVIDVFDMSSYLISMKVKDEDIVKNKDNGIFLIGTTSEPIKLSSGNNLNYIDENEYPIICSEDFYPFSEKSQKDYTISNSINIKNKLGSELNLSFIDSEEIEKFKIVGLYNAKENHTIGNVCYTSYNVVKKMNDKYQKEVFSSNNTKSNFIYMIIDNVENEDLVKKEINNEGFGMQFATMRLNKDFGNNIISILFVATIIFLVLNFSLLIFLSIKKFKKRKREYSVLKVSGYSNYQILSIYYYELFMIFISSYLFSFILYYIISFLFVKLYFSNKIILNNIDITIDILSIIVNALLCIIIYFILIVYLNHKSKKESIREWQKN